MNKKLLLIAALVCGINFAHAQQVIPCYTDQIIEKKIAENPALEDEFRQAVMAIEQGASTAERAGGARIIPVVFHIIHTGGSENISKDQVLDQMRVLNEDYNRTNSDTNLTRQVFKSVAANANIEFRLAQKDPQGNCTDGIVRVYSAQSANAGDNVKALSYWPSNKYLNIWVVRTIDADGQGTILGYAQFPGFGNAETDGVVIRHDVVGTIGSANPLFKNKGRTLTHEIGHWLGLFHTFQGGCSNGGFGEGVADTPPTQEANYGCDTTLNSCTNDNPDLPDQIENYMDYSDGVCQNMFTLGQLDRMNAVLSSSRSNIISSSNLIATGTDGSPAVDCKPAADFYSAYGVTCTGTNVTFNDASYNGTPDTYDWTFDGGSPASSISSTQQVSFSEPGFHQVSLTVSNTIGSDTKTVTEQIFVFPDDAPLASNPFTQDFEGANQNSDEWVVINHDGMGNKWQQVSTAYSGSKGMKFNNHSGNIAGSKDDLILQAMDLTQYGSASLSFKVAHAIRPGGGFSSASDDGLKVYISSTCGTSWQLRYNKSGDVLATTSSTNSAFTPSSQSQWREETVNLGNFAGREHVLIRFEVTSDEGNNIYIDDINISGTASIEDANEAIKLALVPNPATDNVRLTFDIIGGETMTGEIVDVTGRRVKTIFSQAKLQGLQSYDINTHNLAKGLYYVRLTGVNSQYVEKLILH